MGTFLKNEYTLSGSCVRGELRGSEDRDDVSVGDFCSIASDVSNRGSAKLCRECLPLPNERYPVAGCYCRHRRRWYSSLHEPHWWPPLLTTVVGEWWDLVNWKTMRIGSRR
jgi:hypothetical protein